MAGAGMVDNPSFLPMKPYVLILLILAIMLACPACRTTTEYRPDGGKTVIREADPVAIKFAGQIVGGAIAIHAQK